MPLPRPNLDAATDTLINARNTILDEMRDLQAQGTPLYGDAHLTLALEARDLKYAIDLLIRAAKDDDTVRKVFVPPTPTTPKIVFQNSGLRLSHYDIDRLDLYVYEGIVVKDRSGTFKVGEPYLIDNEPACPDSECTDAVHPVGTTHSYDPFL